MKVTPAKDRIDVSVLVPILNEADHIRGSIGSMLSQRFDGELEILCIDGGSEDGTLAILEELGRSDPRVRVLENPGRTIPRALNIGLREARGEFIARMDAHAYYPPEYVATGVGRLGEGNVDWVSGAQIPAGTGRWSRRVAIVLRSWLGTAASVRWPAAFTKETGGDSVTGPGDYELSSDSGVFGGVWRSSTLRALGGWDEAWPVNEDSVLLARFNRDGRRAVLRPDMGAEYVPRDRLAALGRQYWRYGRYRAKTARHYPETLRPIHLLSPGLVLSLAACRSQNALGRFARWGVGSYGGLVAVASVQLGRSVPLRDAASLPIVLLTMHLAWGLGFLVGCARHGPPLVAAVDVAARGRRRVTGRWATGQRLSVMLVAESFSSGVFGVVESIARRLAIEGHEVTIAFVRRPETPANFREVIHPDVDLIELPMRRRSPSQVALATLALRRSIARRRPDVVHLHSTFAGVIGVLGCPRAVPVIYSPHAYSFLAVPSGSMRNRLYRTAERLIALRVSSIGAVSEFEASRARDLSPWTRVTVVPNGIEELDDPPEPADGRNAEPLIVTVGRIGPQRNPRETARILAQVRDVAELIWVGGEPSPGEDTRTLEAAGVQVTGWLSRPAAWEMLRRASAALHWSAYEGQSLAILEALAAGVPVVASDIPPNRELLGGDQVFASEDDAADTLRRLVSDDELRASFLTNQERRRRTYSARRMTSQWLNLYRRFA